MKKGYNYIFKLSLLISVLAFSLLISAQEKEEQPAKENVRAKGTVTKDNLIKLRWSPANTKSWVDGRKYGYRIERYTMSVNNQWQQSPQKITIPGKFQPAPLAAWETIADRSDYAAVVAQAFYGENFELQATSGDIGDIINQANELEQRFSTSVFMAEYDYAAAELAGWAYTDDSPKKDEKYLYRIYLNRPKPIQGDTAAVYIGLDDRKDLEKPIGLNAVFGDKSVMLSWNYTLLSGIYHSYHIERKSLSQPTYRKITDLPVTALDVKMTEIFYTDSLANNEENYTYRIKGITSFNEEGPFSEEISGQGKKTVSCIPQIYNGDFIGAGKARIYWDFECEDMNLVDKFLLSKSSAIDGDYVTAVNEISVNTKLLDFDLNDPQTYVKLRAINKDGTATESFPYLLRQVDSIPPAIPTGLNVKIDSLGVATLIWNTNTESDLQGYRLLRSFSKDGEKSSISPTIIIENQYTDTLSLALGNPKVYYSLSAIDLRYNESEPCPDVAVVKPINNKPLDPIFTGYELHDGGKVTLNWATDIRRDYIIYSLLRSSYEKPKYNKTIFVGNNKINTFTDEVPESGDYRYSVIAEDSINKKKTFSPQKLHIHVSLDQSNSIKGFKAYVDRNNKHIELSWSKHPKALVYKIYKAEDGGRLTLLKEVEADQNRIIDTIVFPDTEYLYTIQFTTLSDGLSQPKKISVNY